MIAQTFGELSDEQDFIWGKKRALDFWPVPVKVERVKTFYPTFWSCHTRKVCYLLNKATSLSLVELLLKGMGLEMYPQGALCVLRAVQSFR